MTQNDDGSVNLADAERFIPAERHKNLFAGKTSRTGRTTDARRKANPPCNGRSATCRRSARDGDRDEAILGRQRSLMAIEEGVGEIFKALKETGQLDNTVIVFASDNGYFYGEHGLSVERRLAYEESIRMPLLVRYPEAVKPGTVRDEFALNIDLAPTLLELAGVAVPARCRAFARAAAEGQKTRVAQLIPDRVLLRQVFPRMSTDGLQGRAHRAMEVHSLSRTRRNG